MNRFGVSEEKAKALDERFTALGVKEDDIEESFIRASGPGGQHVNKASTCVRIKHLPSGIEVRAEEERSQALNRYRARLRLAELEAVLLGRKTEEEQRREKIRRQKRRRSKRAREKMLDAKRRQGEKKRLRGKPGEDE